MQRVRVRQGELGTGRFDGAWWPTGRDLEVAGPELVRELPGDLGPFTRIVVRASEWPNAPRRMQVDGRQVRVASFGGSQEQTVSVAGARRLVLLVVDPDTPEKVAQELFELIEHPSPQSASELLGEARSRAEHPAEQSHSREREASTPKGTTPAQSGGVIGGVGGGVVGDVGDDHEDQVGHPAMVEEGPIRRIRRRLHRDH